MATWCEVIKSGNRPTDEAFREQCFLWETGAPVGVVFLTFKALYMHKNLQYETHKEKRQNTKHNRSPLRKTENIR